MSSERAYKLYSADQLPLLETERKLRSFQSLPEGWHYGEGGPIHEDVIDRVLSLFSIAIQIGFSDTNAFPGLAGEARLGVYVESDYFEFTVLSDLSVTFIHERKGEELVYEEGLPLAQAESRLRTAGEELWQKQRRSISDSSILPITIKNSADFKVLDSIHQQMEESLLLIKDACLVLDIPCVATYVDSTKNESQAILPYSGSSRIPYFLSAEG